MNEDMINHYTDCINDMIKILTSMKNSLDEAKGMEDIRQAQKKISSSIKKMMKILTITCPVGCKATLSFCDIISHLKVCSIIKQNTNSTEKTKEITAVKKTNELKVFLPKFSTTYEQAYFKNEIVKKVNRVIDSKDKFFDFTSLNLQIKGVQYLANSMKTKNCDHVKKIFIDKNNLGDEGVNILTQALMSNSVKILYLNENNINNKGAKYIANFNKQNKHIKELYLHINNIGDEGVKEIISGLKVYKSIESISFNINRIQDAGIKIICDFLMSKDNCITSVDLKQNHYGDSGKYYIETAIKSKKMFLFKGFSESYDRYHS